MIEGVVLCMISGLAWTVVGVVMSRVASAGRNILSFYAVASVLSAILAWATFPDYSALAAGPRDVGRLVFWLSLSGTCNAVGLALMVYAMRIGHRGVTWSMGQSAMVVPFLLAVTIWHDPVGAAGWIGVGLILAAIVLFGLREGAGSPEPGRRRWLLAAWIMLLGFGVSQFLMGYPSRWVGWTDTACLRPAIDVSSTAVIFAAIYLVRRPGDLGGWWGLALLWAIMSIAAYATGYYALDAMTAVGQGAAVFPIIISVGLIAFVVYSRLFLRERWRPVNIAGLLLALAGLACMAWS